MPDDKPSTVLGLIGSLGKRLNSLKPSEGLRGPDFCIVCKTRRLDNDQLNLTCGQKPCAEKVLQTLHGFDDIELLTGAIKAEDYSPDLEGICSLLDVEQEKNDREDLPVKAQLAEVYKILEKIIAKLKEAAEILGISNTRDELLPLTEAIADEIKNARDSLVKIQK